MSRKQFVVISAIICLIFSTAARTQESRDEKAAQEVLEKEMKGAMAGKPEQVRSCYADNFVGYSGNLGATPLNKLHLRDLTYIADLEEWVVRYATSEELDTYAERFKPGAAERNKRLGITHDNEVVSINVKDDCALGVTRHWSKWTDDTTNETISQEFRSVWMLKKIKEEWKITNNIGGISWSFFAAKVRPTEE